MTASRSLRLSAVAALLVVGALTLDTGPVQAGVVSGHVSGQVGCNTTTHDQTIAWNFSSNGQTGDITGASMSGATTGAVTMSPTALTNLADEANGTAEVPNSVVGVVTLTVHFAPTVGLAQMASGSVTLAGNCGGSSTSSSSSSTSSSTTTTRSSSSTTATVAAVAARPTFTG